MRFLRTYVARSSAWAIDDVELCINNIQIGRIYNPGEGDYTKIYVFCSSTFSQNITFCKKRINARGYYIRYLEEAYFFSRTQVWAYIRWEKFENIQITYKIGKSDAIITRPHHTWKIKRDVLHDHK